MNRNVKMIIHHLTRWGPGNQWDSLLLTAKKMFFTEAKNAMPANNFLILLSQVNYFVKTKGWLFMTTKQLLFSQDYRIIMARMSVWFIWSHLMNPLLNSRSRHKSNEPDTHFWVLDKQPVISRKQVVSQENEIINNLRSRDNDIEKKISSTAVLGFCSFCTFYSL